MGSLQGKCVVVVGRGGGIARAITVLARSEGARVVVAGRDAAALARAYDDDGISRRDRGHDRRRVDRRIRRPDGSG